MEQWQDYYQILGVDPGATDEEIKEAYRYKCFTIRPERVKVEKYKQRATDELTRVNEAYEILKDPEKRRQYHAEWLQRAGKAPTSQVPKPQPVVTPPTIRFEDVVPGEAQSASFILQNNGGPYNEITHINPVSWIRIVGYRSVNPPDELPLQFDIEASGEEWGKHYVEYITVRLDDQETQVTVELQMNPKPQPEVETTPSASRPQGTVYIASPRRVRRLCQSLWKARRVTIPIAAVLVIGVILGGRSILSSPPLAFRGHSRSLAVSSMGMIAYFERRNRDIHILSSSDKMTNITTTPDEREEEPAWSPEGSMLAYVKNGDIYIYRLFGGYTEKVKTSGDLRCYSPTWSPDGKKLAFVSSVRDIYVLDLVDGSLLQVTDDDTRKESLTWSPDGKRIAFVLHHGGNSEIYTIRVDGSNLTRLTRNKVWDQSPNWSPDGTKIVFCRYSRSLKDAECHNADVWVMNADGTDQRRLTHDTVKPSWAPYANEDDPAWSPDGRKIYFLDWSMDPERIFVMSAAGGRPSFVHNCER